MKPDRTSTPLQEAAEWSAEFLEGSPVSSEFKRWLNAHPDNSAAWNRTNAALSTFDVLAPSSPEIMAILEATRTGSRPQRQKTSDRRQAMAWAASIAAILIGGSGAWSALQPTAYQTGQDERRTIVLKDGSKLALDAATRITVHYTKSARKLDLVRGQARFDVAHDAARPFSVHAGHQTIIATGTRFDVDVFGPKVVVTLLQGHVVVVADKPPLSEKDPTNTPLTEKAPPAVQLEVGHRLIAANDVTNTLPIVQTIDPGKASAWETGQIVFDGETLDAAAARISRYTEKPVVVTDKDLAKLRITGGFKAGDASTFVEAVTTVFPLRAVRDSSGAITLESARRTN